MPLNNLQVRIVRKLVAELNEKKNDLRVYAAIRNLPEQVVEGICDRIDLLKGFEFKTGERFVDFVYFLYPTLSGGLDELNTIVGNILHRPVDHGISLFFATRTIRYWSLDKRQKKALYSWIDRYVL
jgi:hypothetical protein